MRQPKRGVLRHGKLENLWISRGFPVLEPKPFPALRLPKMGGGLRMGFEIFTKLARPRVREAKNCSGRTRKPLSKVSLK